MRFLPIFVDLTAGTVMLVGSGGAAGNKLALLRAAQANVRWFPGSGDAASLLSEAPPGSGRLDVMFDDPRSADFSDLVALVCASGDELDEQVAARARALRIPVNVVDRPDLSTFIFPAIVDRGDVVVAVGTGGASPVLARRLRERIEAMLPARIGDLAALLARYRSRFAAAKRNRSPRRFWEGVVDGPIGDAALAGRLTEAEAALERALDSEQADGSSATVALVGAGPGDPDLLTLRALQLLQNADVILYDELVTSEILDRARRDAERIFVGKRRGQPGVEQDEINRKLVDAARGGRRVVRLKGGDPFVFGRGGEELEYLRARGIPVVVVPGITAALGCAAEAGLPLTFRAEATRLTFVTANRAEEATEIDWAALADPQMTLVVYMGLATAGAVRDGLIAAGRDPATPAGVLARGTRPDARSAVGPLVTLPALAAAVGEGPALLVIGNAVARSDAWRDLVGKPRAAA